MKIATGVLGCVLLAAGPVQAQDFVDLGFEDVGFTTPPPPLAALPWEVAAPGWRHSDGDSTGYVNYLYGHVGSSQNYVLLDHAHGAPSGAFALGMHGGTFLEGDPGSGFVFAFIEQRGLVPAGTTTLRMVVNTDRFGVSLDGVPLDMHLLGLDPASPAYPPEGENYGGEWWADISSFAGRVATLRITDTYVDFGQSRLVVVDDIRLLAIPEPSTTALTLAGLLVCFAAGWGKMRRHATSAPPAAPCSATPTPASVSA